MAPGGMLTVVYSELISGPKNSLIHAFTPRLLLVLYLITMVMCCTCAFPLLIYIVYDCPVSQLLLPNT